MCIFVKGASFREVVKKTAHVTKEFTSLLEVELKPEVLVGCKTDLCRGKLFCYSVAIF